MMIRTDSILVRMSARYKGLFCAATLCGCKHGYVRLLRHLTH